MIGHIVIGANYGDEGKGTVAATLAKNNADMKVLNILTNGGSQRAHSILTEQGNFTFQHLGSCSYHNADNYFSEYFILNPLQFAKEYDEFVKRTNGEENTKFFAHCQCMFTTPYDMMVNLITSEGKHNTCGMGIWSTISRYNLGLYCYHIETFLYGISEGHRVSYLTKIKEYYEKKITIPDNWKDIWNSPYIISNFLYDCEYMRERIEIIHDPAVFNKMYDVAILENGQGLLLSDNGKDEEDKTPSVTGCQYATRIAKNIGIDDLSLHYVTRPYLTRHGAGFCHNEEKRTIISSTVQEDRTNHYNESQGDFRYGKLDIEDMKTRILYDMKNNNIDESRLILNVTHCDEMDRVAEFKKCFNNIVTFDNPMV